MVEMELEVGSGLEGYKEGELQGRVLNLASGEYGILRINEGKADAIWAGSLDTCAMLVVKGGDVVAALHYRDEKTNGGELSKLVAKVRGKSDETVEVEVVWGRLNRGQESQTKKEVKVELNRTGLDFKREEIGTNGLYVLGKGQVESVEQLPDELAKEISDYYRSLVDAKQRGK